MPAPPTKHVRVAQVISLAQDGLNGQQIADRLGLSYGRVSLLARLGGVALPGSDRDRAARDHRLAALALNGHSSHEISRQLGISPQHVRKIARRLQVEIVGDIVNNGVRRRIDSARVIAKTIEQLDGIGALHDQIDFASLRHDDIDDWLLSLDEALTTLLSLRRQLQEAQT